MTQTTGPTPSEAVGAGWAAVALLIGLGSLMLPRPERVPTPNFTLNGWHPRTALLAGPRAADHKLAADYPLTAAHGPLIQQLHDFGRLETRTAGRMSAPEYAAATQALLDAMAHFWFENGKEAYLAFGVHWAQDCVRALRDAMSGAHQAGVPLVDWLRSNRSDPRVDRLRAYTGNFSENAASWGLITPGNRLAGGTDDLVRLHFKLRWAQLVVGLMDYTFLMDPRELRTLWRWRIEGDRTLGVKQRVEVGQWLRDVEPEYPIYRSLGAVFAQRGDFTTAAGFYREALIRDPFNARLRDNLIYLWRAIGDAG